MDLGAGHRSEEWSLALSSHVVSFLRPRLPQSTLLVAEDTGQEWRTDGDGATVIRSSVPALAALISGRPHGTPPTADAGTALPELNARP
ncbi:hypothetical protein OG524_16610 [Streptomyces sp. NBC_01520]|uniref:hypothetical protein n=1 Tax=Streptomyces sp. NBC_01520 TaxID=2903892 RepID=UPI003864732C